MSSHGAAETQRLKVNIQDQLNRLLQQLTDLEELRDELDDEEYTETRRDTLEQMEVRVLNAYIMQVRARARVCDVSVFVE
jgi:hypothetical protein